MTLLAILFAICFATAAYCNRITDGSDSGRGPVKCFDGPTVWCQNFSVAIECNAFKHCLQTVWSNDKSFTDVHGSSCGSCENTVNTIRDGMDSKTAKVVLDGLLESACVIAPFPLKRPCEKLIDEYVADHLNELLDLIRSNVDPYTVCHLLGLCMTHPEPAVPSPIRDDVVVHYENIVLHFPASNIDIMESSEVADLPQVHELNGLLPLVGMDKCVWGPSYWCGNLTTSKECSSTTHCVRNVWPQREYADDNDSVCQICKDMVKQARDQLLSNETQEELKEVFEGSCKLIPLKEVRTECIKLADEFVPELTEVLASEMNPTAVCTVAGLCNSRHIDDLLAANVNVGMDSCVNCTVAFTEVERFLKNSPKDNVLKKLLQICGELSSYSDACASLVLTKFDDLYPMMTTQMNPFAACHMSGMCAYKYHIHPQPGDVDFQRKVDTMLAVKNDDLPCDLCKQLVAHFKEILIANTTEEEFLEMLDGICRQTGKYEDECLELVKDNFKIFYKFLTEELDPTTICTEVNLCPRAANAIGDDAVSLPSNRLVPVLSSEVKFTNLMPTIKGSTVGDVECRLCKSLINLIQQEMKDPKFKDDIERAVKEVCVLVPNSDHQKCIEFIDEYADSLIKLLSDETDPGIICRLLGVCSTAPKPTNNALCPFCQYMLHFIQEALEDPKDQQAIEDAVEKVCRLVPTSVKDKCNEFIEQYSGLLISVLMQEVDPSLVCPAIKLCPSQQSPQHRCQNCQDFMGEVTHQLAGVHDLDRIKSKVDGLVAAKRNQTPVAVELKVNHYEDIIDMMTAEFSAAESCVYLSFCHPDDVDQKAGDVLDNDIDDQPPTVAVSKPSCEVCKLFVKLYEDKLTSNTTEVQIETMLTELCDKLTDPDLKNNCSRLVDKYVPVLAQLLKDEVKPGELCAMAKFCAVDGGNTSQSECDLCEMMVGAVEGYLGDPSKRGRADSIVVDELGRLCDMVKGEKVRTMCNDAVEQVVPQIIGIGMSIPGWFVCSKLKMCPYGNLLDYKLCTQPDSWCQDAKTAFLCDKIQHCQRTVWGAAKPSH